ncbi:GGDEF domain-containing phosphodiesterase [Sphingomonas xinjiangensis]|uniref:EAL domain-containing protein (Putative c-di-GMP-specific phosphodiesterase class I)/CHASE2 domain-containing sensor protein n=1 Tax=Sphingomonas xinjiangensis TaxID=643568 RepID=A0A840YA44_9SPHN|nr:EAL domain-containing protein [Sphingomonas xinjiangensis]MBB5710207.1 EAL domain-containing protein (putative c-di-GMP-specific phosphodiesterase class I)/CHASE2 domain-containing sensor protein [Sphingomonas xinjiangensis]
MLLAIAIGASGSGAGVDRALRGLDFALRMHPASGQLHIVEIDARSIAAIDRWPWPRSNYAQIVDRLREAGAASIAFDVDLSARSAPEEDVALARALQRAGGKVILPTFGQAAGGGKDGWTDSLPIPVLRAHANLAAVNIRADFDGQVRRAPVGIVTEGVPRPSVAAMVAGVQGTAGGDFEIDYAIDPDTIPRHSFLEIRDGRFDPTVFAGKDVLIGATAVELGDRYAVPGHGVLPGVVIQALAAETLAQGLPVDAGWVLPLLLALLLAWPILIASSRAGLLAASVAAPLSLFTAAVAADAVVHWLFLLSPALSCLALVTTTAFAMRWLDAARRKRALDSQTGLPNRVALRQAMRRDHAAGVVAARIAEFEKLAAGLGETATAELIRRVRDRVALACGGVAVFRIEDRVFAWRIANDDALDPQLISLRALMLSPVEVAGRRVDVSLAFGYAVERVGEGGERAVAQAALAAARALAEGRAWHVHQLEEEDTVDRELSLLGELDEALGKGEIQVLYQPKLDLKTGHISSVEALVRWNHGTRGFLRPDLFIPLAERNDRIAGLTLHVVGQTITDLLNWQSSGRQLTGAVNISAKLLNSAPFIADLREVVENSGISPALLTFEVTESAAMGDPAGASAALQSFRNLGIGISMDDYGTGQSTLSYLKQLPLNELKIDRSFVQFAHQNRGDGALVRSTIDLAHELGLKVVAEGVEEQACLDFLRAIGCDLAQGYLISKPVSAMELQPLLGRTYPLAA